MGKKERKKAYEISKGKKSDFDSLKGEEIRVRNEHQAEREKVKFQTKKGKSRKKVKCNR